GHLLAEPLDHVAGHEDHDVAPVVVQPAIIRKGFQRVAVQNEDAHAGTAGDSMSATWAGRVWPSSPVTRISMWSRTTCAPRRIASVVSVPVTATRASRSQLSRREWTVAPGVAVTRMSSTSGR